MEKCVWEGYGYYKTSCGKEYEYGLNFNDFDFKGFKYCPFCGKKIEVKDV